mmetsp:Transcript_28441/g.82333  ORF Transcript_28441/g.82333 Transcript_28441/m.82333 type:complete len:269 (+) Transcript_28441:527-1333(+)
MVILPPVPSTLALTECPSLTSAMLWLPQEICSSGLCSGSRHMGRSTGLCARPALHTALAPAVVADQASALYGYHGAALTTGGAMVLTVTVKPVLAGKLLLTFVVRSVACIAEARALTSSMVVVPAAVSGSLTVYMTLTSASAKRRAAPPLASSAFTWMFSGPISNSSDNVVWMACSNSDWCALKVAASDTLMLILPWSVAASDSARVVEQPATIRPLSGCGGRKLPPAFAHPMAPLNLLYCTTLIVATFCNTNQSTASVQGGVVKEPP